MPRANHQPLQSVRIIRRQRRQRFWAAVAAGSIVASVGLASLVFSEAATLTTTPVPKAGKSLLKPAKTYKTYKNLRYSRAANTDRLLLDLYVPNNGVKQVPLIIYVHGGGFVAGSKDKGCQPFEKQFMKRGFAVACINYRLATTAKWPAEIIDVKSAIRALRANAARYNIYPAKIGMWGDSAGGHLVAMAGTSAKTKKFDVGSNLKTSSAVQAVVDDYGPTDLAKLIQETKDPGLKTAGALFGSSMIGSPQASASANPITYINGDEPPFLIRHGDKDPLVPLSHSQALHRALQKAGRKSQLVVMKGDGHGGGKFQSAGSLNSLATFFDKYLRP